VIEQAAVDAHDRHDAEVPAAVNRLPQNVRSVGAQEGGVFHAIPHGIEARFRLRFGAHRIVAGIRAAPVRQFHDAAVDVFMHEIERPGARGSREREAFRDGVDRQYAFGAEQERAADRKLSDRAAAPHRYRFAAPDVAEFRRHVPGGKDVRKEQDLLIAETVRHLCRTDIGVRYPQVFSLTATVAAE
jgi:hypothetical protein